MAEMVDKMRNVGRAAESGRLCSGGMPLAMGTPGEHLTVKAIRGRDDTRQFLHNLGFVEGAEVSVVTELGGNLIVNIKGARVAISRAMASRILTE